MEGYGAALKTGFLHAKGEYLGFRTQRAHIQPGGLRTYWDGILGKDVDLVIGSHDGRYIFSDRRSVDYIRISHEDSTVP